jgi:hypothetical protein
VSWLRKTPWRQGKLIAAEDSAKLNLCSKEECARTLVIVASHDCDLTQPQEIEPNVEVIVGKLTTDIDGNFSHAKNPRRIQLAFDGEKPATGEFEAIRKSTVSKSELGEFKPRQNLILSPENANTFQLWLASRYRRSAFPDEFEEKLKEAKIIDKISKAVKPHADDISGLFFDVDAGREIVHINADDTYQLGVYILYPTEHTPEKSLAAAIDVKAKIMLAFEDALYKPHEKWQHVELCYCDVVSEEVLTYAQFKQLKRWRLDHMSLVATPQLPTVAE